MDRYKHEKVWFTSAVLKPKGVRLSSAVDKMEAFQKMIWDNPPESFVGTYGKYV